MSGQFVGRFAEQFATLLKNEIPEILPTKGGLIHQERVAKIYCIGFVGFA
jgi:hypothetical protein